MNKHLFRYKGLFDLYVKLLFIYWFTLDVTYLISPIIRIYNKI